MVVNQPTEAEYDEKRKQSILKMARLELDGPAARRQKEKDAAITKLHKLIAAV